MKGVAHYLKDGTIHKGGTHKMPNGDLHTGSSHNKNSQKLFHFDELSEKAQKKAKKKTAKKKTAKEKSKKDDVPFEKAVEARMKKEVPRRGY
tara:strand:+ start:410 stop:685 length:276 start_codon:yes stop_codon:yes gene_type:complete